MGYSALTVLGTFLKPSGTRSGSTIIHTEIELYCLSNVHVTIAKVNMGYDQYTVSGSTVAVELTFVAFLYHLQTLVHGLSCHSLKFF